MTPLSTTASARAALRPRFGLPLHLGVFAAILMIAPASWADKTDLSSQPLATLPTVQAKPNLLFVLDSSGSMGWSYMPDDLGVSNGTPDQPYDGNGGRVNWYGYRSAQCNGVAFDPTVDTYAPPLKADGTSYPNVSYTNAPVDGYAYVAGTNTTTADLSGSYYYQYSGTQPVMGWAYTTAGHVKNTFFNECSSLVGSTPGSAVFTEVDLDGSSAKILQNYANWYAYYSHRYLLMRTAMGRAIATLDSNYRVGFSTIYDTTAKDGSSNFVDVKDFDATQKGKFYKSLYAVSPSGGTNLPDALSEAGRYYAHLISGQTADPMQYACQRNYTLLSTDGYWNSNAKDFMLDGSTRVGEQDDTEARPMKDGSADTSTSTITGYTAAVSADYTSNTLSRTVAWTRKIISAVGPGTKSTGGTSNSLAGCTKTGYYFVTTTTQTASETQTQRSVAPHSGTSTYSTTVLATNGVTTSTSSTTPATTWTTPGGAVFTYTDSSNASPTSTTPTDPNVYGTTTGTSTACKNSGFTVGTTDTFVAPAWGSFTYTDLNINIGNYSVASGPTTTITKTFTASSETLSDVSEYYYKTDIRTSALGNCSSSSSGGTQDVCANIVKAAGSDKATWQHMNTFTIGLGTSGTLPYDKNYLTQVSGSYADLTSGVQVWPNATTAGNATNIDDLWHAAVNGRGQYYSALNATLLGEAIEGVVNTVQSVAGAGASASTSALNLVAGDNNQVYKASYTTGSWTGDVQAYALNGADATIAADASWSAQDTLDKMDLANRKIYFNNGSATLASFAYGNLTSTQKGYFDKLCSQTSVASQCASLAGADLTAANTGSNLIGYLSGVRTYEAVASGTTMALYRKRDHLLGDIIDGGSVYVGKPPFSYSDAGYADFVTNHTSRKPVVYTASNDGMLHAISADPADGGTELWAYIPTMVMPNLYKLADAGYASKHQYFVDGAPVMGDIKVGTTWKTIVVGGLDSGGKGYYALDITDPASPKPLWEFTDNNLGLTYGNPVITKRADGTWVVVFASGYNNTGGDGLGHLFVLNASTGAKLLDIKTSAGSSTTPSGLAKINAWIDNDHNNTATRFYGGDLLGNLWRFDVDNLVAPNQKSLLLAQFILNGDATQPQPITTRPLTLAIGKRAVIVVGTGRYLGTSDIPDKTQQTVYAVADNLTATGWGDVRSGTNKAAFVQQTLTLDTAKTSATITDKKVDFTNASVGGWWVDLPNSGERVAVDMDFKLGTLGVATAIPSGDACASGGSSWLYYLDAANGGKTESDVAGALWDANSMIVGMDDVTDTSGGKHSVVTGSDSRIKVVDDQRKPPLPLNGAHRSSWRELAN